MKFLFVVVLFPGLISFIYGYNCCPLYITVSATHKSLVVNWDFTFEPHPNIIRLINTDNSFVLEEIPVNNRRGFFETKHVFNNNGLPGNWSKTSDYQISGKHCFPYEVVSFLNGQIVDKQCLKIEPTWMKEFGDLILSDMMIPGTHDSGAFTTRSINLLFKRFILTQNSDIWNQLVTGIRYFDFRVGFRNNEFYLYHASARCTKLAPELDSIKRFLMKASSEVVILDFHRFVYPNNFTSEMHKKLQDLLLEYLGEHIFMRPHDIYTYNLRIKDFWSINQRVIINYNDRMQSARVPWLWEGLRRDWGNIQDPKELLSYIKYISSRQADGKIHVLCAELTLSISYAITHPTVTLKKFADSVNIMLTPLLREYHRADNLRVIATDFFTGNDVINVAIDANRRKLEQYTTRSYYGFG
ncbi:unnamed protein product [Brassicogethes aeneus]|uniref:Phosphatidylinositol-specific phospholipase C X domain-containing protein n=1 Tax=Brassicogethes aeneus TaxID=1431903 RepID=A0A9P0B1U5_BRAAE|nr:unnamed protein product [Brassicogethes aeneus]